jgi:ABC-2 type transport system ATP-binding protein
VTITSEPDGALIVTGLSAAAVGDLAAASGIAVHELTTRAASLEAAYLQATEDFVDFFDHAAPEQTQETHS